MADACNLGILHDFDVPVVQLWLDSVHIGTYICMHVCDFLCSNCVCIHQHIILPCYLRIDSAHIGMHIRTCACVCVCACCDLSMCISLQYYVPVCSMHPLAYDHNNSTHALVICLNCANGHGHGLAHSLSLSLSLSLPRIVDACVLSCYISGCSGAIRGEPVWLHPLQPRCKSQSRNICRVCSHGHLQARSCSSHRLRAGSRRCNFAGLE